MQDTAEAEQTTPHQNSVQLQWRHRLPFRIHCSVVLTAVQLVWTVRARTSIATVLMSSSCGRFAVLAVQRTMPIGRTQHGKRTQTLWCLTANQPSKIRICMIDVCSRRRFLRWRTRQVFCLDLAKRAHNAISCTEMIPIKEPDSYTCPSAIMLHYCMKGRQS